MTTEEKLNKAALLLGAIFGMVKSLDYSIMDENNEDICRTLHDIIHKGINELFYENEAKDE